MCNYSYLGEGGVLFIAGIYTYYYISLLQPTCRRFIYYLGNCHSEFLCSIYRLSIIRNILDNTPALDVPRLRFLRNPYPYWHLCPCPTPYQRPTSPTHRTAHPLVLRYSVVVLMSLCFGDNDLATPIDSRVSLIIDRVERYLGRGGETNPVEILRAGYHICHRICEGEVESRHLRFLRV